MAHVQKNNRASVGHLFDHYGRTADNEKYKYLTRSNDFINPERTFLNYNLAPDKRAQEEILNERLAEVRVLKRKDVNVLCSWVVTSPKDLSPNQEEEFFKETYKFLENRYGVKNVISAYVHKDETTPHMHFAFVPVVWDKKKNIEKVSAKEVITKFDLQSFHTDLQECLDRAEIKCSILNEATKEGNKSVSELKKNTAIEKFSAIQNEVNEAVNKAQKLILKANTIQDDIKVLENEKVSLEYQIQALKRIIHGVPALINKDVKKTVTGSVRGITYEEIVNLQKIAGYVKSVEDVMYDIDAKAKKIEQLKRLSLDDRLEQAGQKKKIQELEYKLDKVNRILHKLPENIREEFMKLYNSEEKNRDQEKVR